MREGKNKSYEYNIKNKCENSEEIIISCELLMLRGQRRGEGEHVKRKPT